jgi:hypothetical protein
MSGFEIMLEIASAPGPLQAHAANLIAALATAELKRRAQTESEVARVRGRLH